MKTSKGASRRRETIVDCGVAVPRLLRKINSLETNPILISAEASSLESNLCSRIWFWVLYRGKPWYRALDWGERAGVFLSYPTLKECMGVPR